MSLTQVSEVRRQVADLRLRMHFRVFMNWGALFFPYHIISYFAQLERVGQEDRKLTQAVTHL